MGNKASSPTTADSAAAAAPSAAPAAADTPPPPPLQPLQSATPSSEYRGPPVFSIADYNKASYELANKIQQGRIAQGCNPKNLEGGFRVEGGVYDSRRNDANS